MNTSDYLDAATRLPWMYGGGPGGFRGHDCTLFPANWCLALSGKDPADDLRGSYSTQKEAEDILQKSGGYFGLMAGRLLSCGWKFSETPDDGSIAIIRVPCGNREFDFPSIRHRGLWVVADPRRLFPLKGSLSPRFIWSVS